MAIASMVCGITGLLGFIFSSIRILNLMKYSNTFGDSLFGAFFQMQLQNQMTTAIVFAIISFVLIILAFIFGIIERKKGKEYKYYGMATAGFIMGLVGIILQLLPIILTTGTVITYNAMNKDGKSTTVISPSPYITGPHYGYYDMIGSVSVKTKDFPVSHSVTVEMIIAYDENDQVASEELIGRRYELRDFVRRYFSDKYAAEIVPEREEALKAEIRNMLNTRFLDKARARVIIFKQLDVMEIDQ